MPRTKELLSETKGETGVKSTTDKEEYIFSSEQDVVYFPFNMHEYEEEMSKKFKNACKMLKKKTVIIIDRPKAVLSLRFHLFYVR